MRAFLRQHLQLIAYLVLAAALVILIYRVETQADANRAVLCNFRADIERRRDSTENFITELQEGKREPIPGISIADLERSRDNLQMTLDSLSGLDCN